MATHDYSIANQSFPATRSDINNALSAIQSSNSAATAPSGAGSTVIGELFYDTTNNKLRIATDANGTFVDVALDASGNLTVTGTLIESSSLKYKTAVSPLTPQLDNIMKLNPVSYVKKSTGLAEIGFIAEEVQEILPTAVAKEAEGVHYSRLTAVLTAAVQELKEIVDRQALEIKELKEA